MAMDERDQHKTSFTTPFGLYKYVRMPFGLCNAPGTFQRLMQICLGDQFFSSVLCYLDDILVYSSTFEEQLERLDRVFDRLREHGLKIKPSKCELFRPEVRYLGHKVSREGVQTDPGKIEVVRSWPTPRNLKELRSFLGFCSFYRRFVKGFSQTAGPPCTVWLPSKLRGGRKEKQHPLHGNQSIRRHLRNSKRNYVNRQCLAMQTSQNHLSSRLMLVYRD